MASPSPKPRGRHVPWGTIDRIAQANVLIGVCLATMLYLVTSWQRGRAPGQPVAPLPEFLLFVLVGLAAVVGVVVCGTRISDLPVRWQRIAAGAATVLFQFALFQGLMAYIG